jgi:hypothetical protein
MINPNYEFCDELNAPEMCVIMNRIWWINNQQEIRKFLDMKASVVQEQILFIPDPVDRTYFMLRWPQ